MTLVEHRYTIEKTERMTRPQAMAFCRENYGLLSGPKVRDYLAERGITVTLPTIRAWADEETARVYRRRHAARLRKVREGERNARAFQRISALRERGLSFAHIAAVLSVDSGTEVDPDSVRYSLAIGRLSPNLARLVT